MNPFSKHGVLLAGLLLASCPWPPEVRADATNKPADLFPDSVVASGKGFEIKTSQLNEAFINYNASVVANGGTIPYDQRNDVRSNLLQHMIISKILVQKATTDDKAKAMKLVEDNIDEARRNSPSPEAFDAQVKASGLTLQQVRDRACEEQVCKRVLQHETTNGIIISEAEARKFYNDNPDKFEEPEVVRVSHILISTLDPVSQHPLPPQQKKAKEQLAKGLKARVDKGEDFVLLVKQYSEDPGSKDKGGEYTFPRGRMVPEFEAAAFTLKTNQISEIVETQYGYHIIKLLEKHPAKHDQFAEVESKIKDYLIEKEAEKTLPAYIEKIKVEAAVKMFDPDTGKPLPTAAK